MEQLRLYFQNKKELVEQEDLECRRTITEMLMSGLFKRVITQDDMSTKYRQEYTVMQQLAMSVLEQNDKLEDYDPDLQMAIRKVLIQYW